VSTGGLHVVTDDGILARPGFTRLARTVLEAAGTVAALHLRGHGTTGGRLFELARDLVGPARAAGARLLVNDRLDVALAADADGVQLGRRSLPVARARAAIGSRLLGYSAHDAREADAAADDGADFVIMGTIFETSAHPGRAAGVPLIEAAVRATAVPVIAIGGLTPERVATVLAAGAAGVAVRGAVWDAADPAAAATAFVRSLARA
jgi:thiamine-phosphate diphosphorylase